MESSGPEGGKVRGPASLVYERYLQLARDAASSGDRVLSENFLQHADHYFRLVRSMQPATPTPPPANERFEGGEDEEAAGGDHEGGEEAGAAAEAGDQPDVEFPQGQQPQQFERDGDHRRRRGRRRYRPGESEGGDQREAREGVGREGAEGRDERRERRERPPRDRNDGEDAGPEGFSSSPKPAFLRD